MRRTGLATALSLGWLLSFCPSPAPGSPPADKDNAFNTTLALQQAMATATDLLRRGETKKAVETLENELARVNGHSAFLRLLRQAYRGYIKELWIANNAAAAKRYLGRLCILEPSAAHDASLRPPETSTKILPPERKGLLASLPKFLPDFARSHPKKEAAETPAKSATIRATMDDAPRIEATRTGPGHNDPFALANQDPASLAGINPGAVNQQARQLVARAEQEFERRRYVEARALFDQAYRADKSCLGASRQRWAYCILSEVVTHLNEPAPGAASLNDLERQVRTALELAPTLDQTGQSLLREIDERGKTQNATANPETIAAVTVNHLGQNKEGWQVAETPYFRIFHNERPEQVEKVAAIAENTRRAMYRKWFGSEGTPWTPKCELILHPTGENYTRMTEVPASSPGHSRIELDRLGHRVVSRRMDLRCDISGMTDCVLPHETTHVVLAGNFGNHNVPRWADEGIAVLTEPAAKVDQHRRNLEKSRREGTLFGVLELMQLDNYPEPRRISAFYAESVCLVEYMTGLKGPQEFTAFVRDGLRDGYEVSLRKHYGMEMAQLQQGFDMKAEGRVASK